MTAGHLNVMRVDQYRFIKRWNPIARSPEHLWALISKAVTITFFASIRLASARLREKFRMLYFRSYVCTAGLLWRRAPSQMRLCSTGCATTAVPSGCATTTTTTTAFCPPVVCVPTVTYSMPYTVTHTRWCAPVQTCVQTCVPAPVVSCTTACTTQAVHQCNPCQPAPVIASTTVGC
ncbi:hypothetical protein SCHPADRAFT_355225 [Schizopora paradoxa]|uniref:Uncharacterized protein n=1 Tax=Schizopora paradoxa TaxID=27342 RepID=A0A0H2RVW6_9AGAM|nr:hypothetical protein SCHPADRAFT_355225 [Schizopora paradoxa]